MKLWKKIMQMTPLPNPVAPVLFWTAVNAIQIANVHTIPVLEARNRGRRPIRSTSKANTDASIQFVMPMIPLRRFWNLGSVMPTSSSTLLQGRQLREPPAYCKALTSNNSLLGRYH